MFQFGVRLVTGDHLDHHHVTCNHSHNLGGVFVLLLFGNCHSKQKGSELNLQAFEQVEKDTEGIRGNNTPAVRPESERFQYYLIKMRVRFI